MFTRHDFVTTSRRAAISFVVRECRCAGDWLSNARSSRVEFIEVEFNGTGVRPPYIKHKVSGSDAAST
jgi:hypothetical protein